MTATDELTSDPESGKDTKSTAEPAGTTEDPAGAAEPGADPGHSPAESPMRSRSVRALVGVLVLLLIATTSLAAVLGWQWKDSRDVDRAATAALTAAQQYAVALTSIDAKRMDADFATLADGATGKFKDMYTRSAEQLKHLLAEAQSVSSGRVVASSVQSASRDRVVVLLFVDAQITNTTTPEPRLDRNRIIMTMDRVGDRWLAGEVELV
ncbi:hypothetical protein [Nocardia sp. NPDC019395]|uniref:hypothetical protein n=1 Tax=Nocardia sp. NPDC019395 TaxID=3154686 RepID=UPI0034019AA2